MYRNRILGVFGDRGTGDGGLEDWGKVSKFIHYSLFPIPYSLFPT